jgi:hypothetical protein
MYQYGLSALGASMPSSKTKDSEKRQLDRFRKTARQLECDEDQARFEKRLGKIATVNPTLSRAGSHNERN